jgi:hypothetical protein
MARLQVFLGGRASLPGGDMAIHLDRERDGGGLAVTRVGVLEAERTASSSTVILKPRSYCHPEAAERLKDPMVNALARFLRVGEWGPSLRSG